MGGEARRLLLVLVLLIVCVSGCLPRQRFNKNCEWTQDAPRPLDLSDPGDWHHLVQDAQLAEELAQRYSDFKHKELTGYEGHGGYLQQGRVTRGCMERMFSEIERTHGVTREKIQEARNYRDWRFDLSVLLSFVPLYVLASTWLCGLLVRAFGHHGVRLRIAVLVSISLVVSMVGIALLGLWSTTAEMIRIGNDHVGASRAARSPWFSPSPYQWGRLFVGAMLLFWTIAWVRGPVRPREAPPGTGPQGIVLH